MAYTLDTMPDLTSAVRLKAEKKLSKMQRVNKKRNEKKKKRARERRQEKTSLPILDHIDTIVESVEKNQVVVITAETGSGKSSQVPRILLDAGINKGRMIACTQPRRVAARNVAQHVANEMKVEVGEEVGYHVRFENQTSPLTIIKYMTDGILLREYFFNKNALKNYSIIIVDEIHERSVEIDLLLGVMKMELPKHPDLKLVIMSATMNTADVSKFFNDAPVLRLEGTLNHPVDIRYEPGFTEEHILKVIYRILDSTKEGHVLVFLPGEPEIIRLRGRLKGRSMVVTLPAHSNLPPWEMDKIFSPVPQGHRKLILSTNVTETSLTVEDLQFVVDTGYANAKVFDAKTGISRLETRLISRSQAQQRRGRVGRTCAGMCYRLYRKDQLQGTDEGEEEKDEVKPTERRFRSAPEPQIQREDLTHVVLMLRLLKMHVNDFPWLSFPNTDNVIAATQELIRLRAFDSGLKITDDGERMAKFPLHPRMAALVLRCKKRGSEYGALLLSAILSTFNGRRQRCLAKLHKQHYNQIPEEVDALISIMHDIIRLVYNADTQKIHDFASQNKIPLYTVYEVVHVYRQLLRILKKCGSTPPETPENVNVSVESLSAMVDIKKSLTEIFVSNCAARGESGEFVLPNKVAVNVQPILGRAPKSDVKFVSCTELFQLSDIREVRKDTKPRMVNTFIPRIRH